MKSALALTALLLGAGATRPLQDDEAWTELAAIHDEAVSLWVTDIARARSDGLQQDEWPAHPATELWPDFVELAEAGDERALIWLLVNVEQSESQARTAELERILKLIRRAGHAEWVAEALPELVAMRAGLDEDALAQELEALEASDAPRELRVAALIGLAELQLETDPEIARNLRLEAARLWQNSALEPSKETGIDELSKAVSSELRRRSSRWFSAGFAPTPDDVYFATASVRPKPELLFRPMMVALAESGSARARLWFLENTYAQSEAERNQMRAHLSALAEIGLDAKSLASMRYQASSLAAQLGASFVEQELLKLIATVDEADRAGLLLGLGVALCESADDDAEARARGLALLTQVAERWPDSDEARSAAGKRFRFEHLTLGQIAPDFATEDVDGTPFRLSDYKGKVTVVDFWGFW